MTDDAKALLEKLPELLKQTPQLRYQIYDLLAETFVRRDELTRVLDEIKASREQADRRFEAMDRRFEEAAQRDQATQDWVGVVVGGFQRRAGRSLEDAVAGTLRVALTMKDLDPQTIRMRQRVEDPEGLIGPRDRSYEYDIFASNGQACIFEVKSVPDEEDVQRFADKCMLVERKLGLRDVRRVIVTLAKSSSTAELAARCTELGVELA